MLVMAASVGAVTHPNITLMVAQTSSLATDDLMRDIRYLYFLCMDATFLFRPIQRIENNHDPLLLGHHIFLRRQPTIHHVFFTFPKRGGEGISQRRDKTDGGRNRFIPFPHSIFIVHPMLGFSLHKFPFLKPSMRLMITILWCDLGYSSSARVGVGLSEIWRDEAKRRI